MKIGLGLCTIALVSVALAARGPSPLVVHEWGTITTRHLPDGTPDGRLNHIGASEELPAFVHRYEPPATRDTNKQTLKTPLLPGRPDVTMRLETPVLYFYPPPGSAPPPPFAVTVRFRGGVLNEFYPGGDAWIELDRDRIDAGARTGELRSMWDGVALNNYVVGGLRWHGVTLKETVPLRQTPSNVWLAPRRVRSTGVVTQAAGTSTESERYLFYRGVAHLEALVQTEQTPTDVRLRAPRHLEWMRGPSATIGMLWFADIRADGQVAFREDQKIIISKSAPSADLGKLASFSAGEYAANGLAGLRQSMKQALVAEGLFDDEAEAMLETWKESYFRTPGLRIFYIVPPEWTAYFLPIQISVPHELTRVLVGRIDLVPRKVQR